MTPIATMLAALLGVSALAVNAAAFAAQSRDDGGMGHAPVAEAAPPATMQGANTGPIGARIKAASPGDTIVIGPGVHAERLFIDKPLTLVGEGMPVLDGGGSGDIVTIVSSDVEIRGLVIRNTGSDLDKENCGIRAHAARARIIDNDLQDVLFGIDLKTAPDSVVRGNRIGGKVLDVARRGDGLRLWRSDRVIVEHNDIHDGRDAILWYSTGVVVRHNRSYRCRYGFHLMFSDSVTIEDNDLTDNSVGVYLMYSSQLSIKRNRMVNNRGPSGYGLGLKEADQYEVTDNTFVGNRAGIYIDGSPFTDTKPGEIAANTFAYNDVGVVMLPAVRGNRLHGNNFVDNLVQVGILGRGNLEGNEFFVDKRGNYWSDYVGYDEDRDGIGDYEYASEHLFENLLDREPKLRIFLLSPAQQAVEFVARALPAMRPEPKFMDDYPLVEPVVLASARTTAGASSLGMTSAAVVLLGGAFAVLAATRSRLGLARETAPAHRNISPKGTP